MRAANFKADDRELDRRDKGGIMEVRRCGWLWRKYAVFVVEIAAGVGGMCGDIDISRRISPRFDSESAATTWGVVQGLW
jgi:hypothetical protein